MKKIGSILLAAVLIGTMLTGCGQQTGDSPSASPSSASGATSSRLSIIGSTSVHPLMEDLVNAYKTKADVTVDLQGVGSSAGIKQASEGTADIGMSSRELKEEEKTWGLNEYVIANDGIAVIVNPANGVTNLTKDQVAQIFKGEITNWKEVGGEDKNIVVISRESGSGTRGAFEEILGLEGESDGKTVSLTRADALINDSNGAVKAGVASRDAAIGYLSLGAVDSSVKALNVDDVVASEDNVKNGSYPIARPFIIMTKGTPSETEQGLIDFILSDEGQNIVAENYVSVN